MAGVVEVEEGAERLVWGYIQALVVEEGVRV